MRPLSKISITSIFSNYMARGYVLCKGSYFMFINTRIQIASLKLHISDFDARLHLYYKLVI